MTSIPADPSLCLGNVIQPWHIVQLQAIAKLQNPVDAANDRLNNLTMSNYKIRMIYHQMVNMKVDLRSLEKINDEMVALKKEMTEAALELGMLTLASERAIRLLREKLFRQTKISMQPDSPVDFQLSTVEKFPLSFDSLKFDVQFFQVQRSADASTAHSASVSAYVQNSFSSNDQASTSAEAAASAHASTMAQVTTNSVDSTIVITAFSTHKQVDVMNPCIIDPEKAVAAWNFCHPSPLKKIRTNAIELWRAALLENPLDFGTISILSGTAKSSSFVGYVHLLKTERTMQTQNTATVAASVTTSIENNMSLAAMSGKFSQSAQASASVSALFSTARIRTNCSLQCQGIIPSIVSKTMETTVQNMNPDPSAVMNQLGAIANAGSTDVNKGMEAAAGNATKGAQFMELNNDYMTKSIQALGEETRISNKVIDTNSMMTAFEDYVNKASAGDCGVPTAYFMKELTKADIAKLYIRKFYPNGASSQRDARRGQLGQISNDSGQEDK